MRRASLELGLNRKYAEPTQRDYPYFSYDELKCRCGCGEMRLDEHFLFNLVDLREALGFALHINSGYRCPKYNQKFGSGHKGPHTIDAVDIGISGQTAFELVREAPNFGMVGIGVSQRGAHEGRYIHIDGGLSAPHLRPWIWSY